jgi:hypothetical protein
VVADAVDGAAGAAGVETAALAVCDPGGRDAARGAAASEAEPALELDASLPPHAHVRIAARTTVAAVADLVRIAFTR